MIIRKIDDYFLIKVYQDELKNFNIFDIEDVKNFFQIVFQKLKNKYEMRGLIDIDVYVNLDYGMIIEIHPICKYFDEIEIKIHMHLDSIFLIQIDMNNILDYEDVYYYKGKFYGTYLGLCDNEVFYRDTDDIVRYGIKVC